MALKRILLKLSGESLMGEKRQGIDGEACRHIAKEIIQIQSQGIEVAVVVGGGNIFRGARATGLPLDRSPADQIGMLATVMNGIALQQTLQEAGISARVMSAIPCPFVESYVWQEAMVALKDAIVVFVGGIGHPYVTTDTTAALRAAEIHADLLVKATTVDGVYDSDPKQSADALKFERINYSEVLHRRLRVMDAAAIAICQENRIPIRVCSLFGEGAILRALSNESVGTLVEGT